MPQPFPVRLRHPYAAVLIVLALVVGLVAGPSGAGAASPAAPPAAAWLAGLVGPDGSVENPYDPGVPSVSWTLNVALSIAMTGTETEALDRALGYLDAHVEDYVVVDGADNPGRLGYLVLLVAAVGGDPHAFGVPATDLVARLDATYGAVEPGVYGTPDPFSSVTLQSLAVLALVAADATVPVGAVQWLVDQQCVEGSGPDEAIGGWQGYRAPAGGGLEDCVVDPETFVSPDTNNTAFAVQAIAAAGSSSPLAADPRTFLDELQAESGPRAGGFAFDLLSGGAADPNSTAVGIQALLAIGSDLSTWSVGGQDPLASLESWVVPTGPEAGALSSPFSDGFADVFATTQGVWGLAFMPFPFTAPTPTMPTTTTTTPIPTTTVESAASGSSGGSGGGSPLVTPTFTG